MILTNKIVMSVTIEGFMFGSSVIPKIEVFLNAWYLTLSCIAYDPPFLPLTSVSPSAPLDILRFDTLVDFHQLKQAVEERTHCRGRHVQMP